MFCVVSHESTRAGPKNHQVCPMANPFHVLSLSLADGPDWMSLQLQFSTLSFLASGIPLSPRRLTPVSVRFPLSEGELKRRFDHDHAGSGRWTMSGISAHRTMGA